AGKTALAIAAAKAHRGRVMWLHLDALDGDPATFLAGLAEAASGPWGLGEVALPAFSPEYLPGLAAFTGRTLAALLAGAGAPLLVLDDYQELPDDSPLHRALAAAFDGLLGGHHPAVLVLSRRAPPPPYARLRAS